MDLIDIGANLTHDSFDRDRDAVLARAREAGVARMVVTGASREHSPLALRLAQAHPGVLYATAGVHPHHAVEYTAECDAEMRALHGYAEVVAVGETGLDYYWQKDAPEWQRARFRTHIRAARATGKPLVIHTRSAADDTLRLMREEQAGEAGGVMHCFTESWEVAEAALEQGFYISFSGIVTFRNAKDLKEVAKRVPLDRLLIETDSPYLAPVPHRGRTNEPGWVVHVAEEIARLRDVPLASIEQATTDNFFRLFRHVQRPV